MARRTGVPTLYNLARRLCIALAKFTPLIKKLYPTNTGLHDALDAANAACSILASELLEVREFGD